MKNIERLLTVATEQVGKFLCNLIENCDDCPAFISERCKDENWFLKWIKEEDGLGSELYEDND